MKNLIKLLAIIAMITVSASNVCAQTTDTLRLLWGHPVDTPKNTVLVTLKLDYDIVITKIEFSFEDGLSQIYKITSNIFNDTYYTLNDITLENLNDTISKNNTVSIKINVDNSFPVEYTINKIVVYYNKITTPTGLNNNLLAAELNLYSYDNMVVLENTATPKPLSVNIYNLSGQLVVTENVDGLNTRNEINTTLPNGIYMVHVSDGVNTMVKKLYISK